MAIEWLDKEIEGGILAHSTWTVDLKKAQRTETQEQKKQAKKEKM